MDLAVVLAALAVSLLAMADPRPVSSIFFPFEVKAPAPLPLTGSVRDRDGETVAGACVELLAADGRVRAPPQFTGPDGAFHFPRIPAGPARITITIDGYQPRAKDRIADHHDQNPAIRVLLRPMIVVPPGDRVNVPRIRREGEIVWNGGPARFIEVFPLALEAQGYSAACEKAARQLKARGKSPPAAGSHRPPPRPE